MNFTETLSAEEIDDDWDAYIDPDGNFLKDKCIIQNDSSKYKTVVKYFEDRFKDAQKISN